MESNSNKGRLDEGLTMKHLTLIELISVIVVLVLLTGLGYTIWQVTDLKYQAMVVKKLSENEKWRNDITILLNYNLQNGKLVMPQVERK